MKKYDIFFIGHITADEVLELNGARYDFYGGAELFSSYAAYYLGAEVGLLTKMSDSEKKIVDILPMARDDIYFLSSKYNTSMLNKFLSQDRERRELLVSSIADPFLITDLPADISSDVYYLAGLILGDYQDGMIECLSKRGQVAVDMQGFLRCYDEKTSLLYFKDYKHKKRDFPLIDYLKTDAAEAEILTGTDDRKEAAKIMCGWGAKEVMITHHTEIIICDGHKIYSQPIKSRNFSGRSGRGDTAFSAYITERRTKNISDSLLFATAAVSLKMEQPGPFKKKSEDVEAYIDLLYEETNAAKLYQP